MTAHGILSLDGHIPLITLSLVGHIPLMTAHGICRPPLPLSRSLSYDRRL
jgi:hypothetical protein